MSANLAARLVALFDIASPEMLHELSAALLNIAEAHPGESGQYVGSIAAEAQSLALSKSTSTGLVR